MVSFQNYARPFRAFLMHADPKRVLRTAVLLEGNGTRVSSALGSPQFSVTPNSWKITNCTSDVRLLGLGSSITLELGIKCFNCTQESKLIVGENK